MLDTCHAGALGSTDPSSLIKRSASTQWALVSAAQGNQSSYDAPNQPHGIFTLAMIWALTDSTLAPRGPVTLRGAFDAVVPQVAANPQQLRGQVADPVCRAQMLQTPVLTARMAIQRSVIGLR